MLDREARDSRNACGVPVSLLEEIKAYVDFSEADEAALRAFHGTAAPHFPRIAKAFYGRILTHPQTRRSLDGSDRQLARLEGTLVSWLGGLLGGPWDDAYFAQRARIGQMHVRVGLAQDYIVTAANLVRRELGRLLDIETGEGAARTQGAVDKALDIDTAILLHAYDEDLRAQTARAERLATFGRLIGTIGQELRDPLGVIDSSIFLLRQRAGADPRLLRHLDRIAEQVGIANGIVAGLFELVDDVPLIRRPVHLGPVVAGALDSASAPPSVKVGMSGLDRLPVLAGDPIQLQQVFVNLIVNAVQAVAPAGGEVFVDGRVDGDAVAVAVADSGPGVDPHTRARLFEPLVTTKAKGLGLGLALVRRIVERHGGTVVYESDAKGHQFVVRLPLPEAAS